MNILLRLIRSYLKFSIVRMFIRMKWKLTRNLQRWISIGKALNFIGHMKVILVAIAYTRLSSLFNQIPSSLVRTWWVSNSFKFMISTSGSHNLRRIWRLTAVSLSSSTGASELFIVVKNGFEKNAAKHHYRFIAKNNNTRLWRVWFKFWYSHMYLRNYCTSIAIFILSMPNSYAQFKKNGSQSISNLSI